MCQNLDFSNYYYTLSTISQVLAAFLGLFAIFLFQLRATLKDELFNLAELLYGFLEGVKENVLLHGFQIILRKYIDSKSLNNLSDAFNMFFINEKYKEIIYKIQGSTENSPIRLYNIVRSESSKLLILLDKTYKWAIISFLFGIPTSILAYSFIIFIPFTDFVLILVIISIFILTSIISITYMATVILKYLIYEKSRRKFGEK